MAGKDKIDESKDEVRHESAGGFLFYDDPNEGLKVALVKKIDGSYLMPKGHIQEGETPEDAATRELTEELSLQKEPKLMKKVGVESYSFDLPGDKRKHYKDVHVYIFETDVKEEISNEMMERIEGEKGRFDEPEWVKADEAYEKLTYDNEVFLQSRKLWEEL